MDSSYIKGIDGMRGLAVLAVLLYHLDPYYLPGGFSGVDVFFVISGFVVTASLSKRKDASFKEFTFAFYKRRVVRILPALLFSITSVSILTALFIPVSWLSQSTLSTA